MIRTKVQLVEAAHHVNGEWALLADMARLLPTSGAQSLADTAALEATLVHARCLINFCCGGYQGGRNRSDIRPEDFLGRDWWPRDEEFDRTLRGRLRFINQELQHLSWQRVLDEEPLGVSVTLLAHEVHWAMHLFVDELRHRSNDWLPNFEIQEQYITARLPTLDRPQQTSPHLAPVRENPTPP